MPQVEEHASKNPDASNLVFMTDATQPPEAKPLFALGEQHQIITQNSLDLQLTHGTQVSDKLYREKAIMAFFTLLGRDQLSLCLSHHARLATTVSGASCDVNYFYSTSRTQFFTSRYNILKNRSYNTDLSTKHLAKQIPHLTPSLLHWKLLPQAGTGKRDVLLAVKLSIIVV